MIKKSNCKMMCRNYPAGEHAAACPEHGREVKPQTQKAKATIEAEITITFDLEGDLDIECQASQAFGTMHPDNKERTVEFTQILGTEII